jgi:hypothetical protein
MVAIEQAIAAETEDMAKTEYSAPNKSEIIAESSMVDISATAGSETKAKSVDEVDALMDQYDKKDANENYLNSDEFKSKIKAKENKQLAEDQKQVEDL